jgi:polysaccharide biosynthesis PFTS motif protein
MELLVYQIDPANLAEVRQLLQNGKTIWYLLSSKGSRDLKHPNLKQLPGAVPVERRIHTALDRSYAQIPQLLESPYFRNLSKALGLFLKPPYDRQLLSAWGLRRLFRALEIEEALSNSKKDISEFDLIPNQAFEEYFLLKESLERKQPSRKMLQWASLMKLLLIWLKIFLKIVVPSQKPKKKHYKYAAMIISEDRHSHDNVKSYNAMFSDSRFDPNEIVFFPFTSVSEAFKKKIHLQGYDLQPKLSHYSKRWIGKSVRVASKLLSLIFSVKTSDLIQVSEFFSAFLYWNTLLDQLKIDHFVAMSGYTLDTYVRNAVFKDRGTQSWFFTESGTFPEALYRKGFPSNHVGRVTSFFIYDHFVAWNQRIVEEFKASGARFQQSHVVGCVWSSPAVNGKKSSSDRTRISIFDTYYPHDHPFGPEYRIQFYKDILRIVEEFPEINWTFKPKFPPHMHLHDRAFHDAFDEFKKNLGKFPNAQIHPGNQSSVELVQDSDLVITCFPSSVSVEAAGGGKPGILYEPFDHYRGTLMDGAPGFFKHGYRDLKDCIQAFIANEYRAPYDSKHPLFLERVDAFQDGRGMERLRNLLIKFGSQGSA